MAPRGERRVPGHFPRETTASWSGGPGRPGGPVFGGETRFGCRRGCRGAAFGRVFPKLLLSARGDFPSAPLPRVLPGFSLSPPPLRGDLALLSPPSPFLASPPPPGGGGSAPPRALGRCAGVAMWSRGAGGRSCWAWAEPWLTSRWPCGSGLWAKGAAGRVRGSGGGTARCRSPRQRRSYGASARVNRVPLVLSSRPGWPLWGGLAGTEGRTVGAGELRGVAGVLSGSLSSLQFSWESHTLEPLGWLPSSWASQNRAVISSVRESSLPFCCCCFFQREAGPDISIVAQLRSLPGLLDSNVNPES